MPVFKCYACGVTSDNPMEMLNHDDGGHINPSDRVAALLMKASTRRCHDCGNTGATYTALLNVVDPKSVSQAELNIADNDRLHAWCRTCIQKMVKPAPEHEAQN